jgi:S1-C subfamily serine protease
VLRQLETRLSRASGEDIALVFLDDPVAGVTPAPIADLGYLDELDLKSETFTVVGYGTDAFITGSAASPKAITIFDGIRSYREVSAIAAMDAFPDRFLKITAGVCFGDSGGPLFHDGTIVAINTWTFSWRCAGPNLEYRVDSAVAQAFLDAYL